MSATKQHKVVLAAKEKCGMTCFFQYVVTCTEKQISNGAYMDLADSIAENEEFYPHLVFDEFTEHGQLIISAISWEDDCFIPTFDITSQK